MKSQFTRSAAGNAGYQSAEMFVQRRCSNSVKPQIEHSRLWRYRSLQSAERCPLWIFSIEPGSGMRECAALRATEPAVIWTVAEMLIEAGAQGCRQAPMTAERELCLRRVITGRPKLSPSRLGVCHWITHYTSRPVGWLEGHLPSDKQIGA